MDVDPIWTAILDDDPNAILHTALGLSELDSYTLSAGGIFYSPNIKTTRPIYKAALSGGEIIRSAGGVAGRVSVWGNSGGNTKHWHSSNYGSAPAAVTVVTYANDLGGDTDDFNLGIVVAAANNRLYRAGSYTGAFTLVAGTINCINGSTPIAGVKIPHKKLATQFPNNDATSLQILIAMSAAVSGITLAAITINTTPTATSNSDLTPIISGTTYVPITSPNNFETYAANTQRILLLAKPNGAGNTHLLASVNGGTSWTIQQSNLNAEHVHFVEFLRGGDGSKCWFAGDGGVFYSDDLGVSLEDKTGDFVTVVGTNPSGALQLEQLAEGTEDCLGDQIGEITYDPDDPHWFIKYGSYDAGTGHLSGVYDAGLGLTILEVWYTRVRDPESYYDDLFRSNPNQTYPPRICQYSATRIRYECGLFGACVNANINRRVSLYYDDGGHHYENTGQPAVVPSNDFDVSQDFVVDVGDPDPYIFILRMTAAATNCYWKVRNLILDVGTA